MNRRLTTTIPVVSITLMVLAHFAAAQGPLTPPGAPAPTMKTLDQVEPRIPLVIGATGVTTSTTALMRITQPGSYYLTGELQGTTGKLGIEIDASHVTVDLSGYRLIGNGGTRGIRVLGDPDEHRHIVIRNGHLSGWSSTAVNVAQADFAFLEKLHCDSNGNGVVAGDGSQIVDCVVTGNSGTGFFVQATSINAVDRPAIIRSCVAHGNGSWGFRLGDGSVIENCIAQENGSAANHDGILVGDGSTVINCTAKGNNGSGIEVSNGCSVRGCSASENTGIGFLARSSANAQDCVAFDNGGSGFSFNSGSRAISCTAHANESFGFEANNHSTISQCIAYLNLDDGIRAGFGCTILDCTVNRNGQSSGFTGSTTNTNADGIQVDSFCIIRGTTAYDNRGFGIRLINSQSFVQQVNVHANDVGGIEAGSNGNTVRGSAYSSLRDADGNDLTGGDIAPRVTNGSTATHPDYNDN